MTYRETDSRPDRETRLILKGDRNQCPSCYLNFNSTYAFDKHRYPVGHIIGKNNRNKAVLSRRCLSIEEMQSIGMCLNKDNFWVTEKRSEEVIKTIRNTEEDPGIDLSEDLD